MGLAEPVGTKFPCPEWQGSLGPVTLTPSWGLGSRLVRHPHMLSPPRPRGSDNLGSNSYGDLALCILQGSVTPQAGENGTRQYRGPTTWGNRGPGPEGKVPTSPHAPPKQTAQAQRRGGRVRRGWGRPGQVCRGPGCTARCPSHPWLGSAAAASTAQPRLQMGLLSGQQLAS